MHNRGVSIHWRGQTLRNEPLMDGVSMISQCPINSFTAFQYKFRASDVGTHLWYLHTGREGILTIQLVCRILYLVLH